MDALWEPKIMNAVPRTGITAENPGKIVELLKVKDENATAEKPIKQNRFASIGEILRSRDGVNAIAAPTANSQALNGIIKKDKI